MLTRMQRQTRYITTCNPTYIDRDTSIYTNVKETTQVLKLKEGITYDDKAFK